MAKWVMGVHMGTCTGNQVTDCQGNLHTCCIPNWEQAKPNFVSI